MLSVRGLSKSFPGVLAVDGVDLTVDNGEIVALLGQNGAGKSTLIQVLSGVHPAGTWEGVITMAGAPFRPASVFEAESGGIAFLAQEVNVAPQLTVAETLALNREPVRFGLVDRPLMIAHAQAALLDFGIDVAPATPMGELDLATQQLVLIVRALSKRAKLLILDEPTAALADREADRLFGKMRALRARGVSVIFVSHRLAEVFEISDRIVVMRDGRIGGEFTTSETSRDIVVAHMVGAAVPRDNNRRLASASRPGLGCRGLSVTAPEGGRTLVEDVDIEIGAGEIVGLFGLLGSGVVETAMALFGAWRGKAAGEITIEGRRVTIDSPAQAVALGMGLIAQDRRDGLSLDHSIYDNAILANLPALSHRAGFLDAPMARRQVTELFGRLAIKAADIDVPVGALSGGNQQKVQVARWLAAGVKVLLLIDPTRGVDIGARAEISRIWVELAAGGCAILLVSSDAEELVDNCDRAVVLRNGRVAGEVSKAELGEHHLLRLAAGV